MALPTLVRTWSISPNNRILYVSYFDTMQRYLHGVKTFLKAHGYVCKGSASAGTGAMDGVDRWALSADVTPRSATAIAATSQAWIVLTDGNGCDLLLAYQGGTDDVARISFSAAGLFVASGTPEHQPTATDEVVITSGTTLISTPTSADRLWFGWVDSEHKMCRFAIAHQGLFVGRVWGLELVGSVAVTGSIVTWAPAVWGFAYNAQQSNNINPVGQGRVIASSVPTTVSFSWGFEFKAADAAALGNNKLILQGARGYQAVPMAIGSTTIGAQGPYGTLYDQWVGRGQTGIDGDVYGGHALIGVAGLFGGTGACLWPWDGTTTPVLR